MPGFCATALPICLPEEPYSPAMVMMTPGFDGFKVTVSPSAACWGRCC